MYKKIVVLSGKGGTGKTSITSALSEKLDKKILVDCDVDAADLNILLKIESQVDRGYYGTKKASIDNDLCGGCGLCEELCRFDAIHNFSVDFFSCEGCGLCYHACPDNAIKFESVITGNQTEAVTEKGEKFYFASLMPGEGNSGKLVTEVKKEAENGYDNQIGGDILIDGPPGIGCPVNASVTGTDFAVVVTEPTLSGKHDLKRILLLLDSFNISHGVIINKYDLNENISEDITRMIESKKTPLLGKLPFDYSAVEALQQKEVFYRFSPRLEAEMDKIIQNLLKLIR